MNSVESVNDIWKSFFNSCYITSNKLIENKLVSIEKLRNKEHYLYLEILSITIIETIIKSINIDGIQLDINNIITDDNCPGEHKSMYRGMIGIKNMITGLNYELLKKLLLHKKTECDLEYMKVVSAVSNISIIISQIPIFKVQIKKIISLLLNENNKSFKNLIKKLFK